MEDSWHYKDSPRVGSIVLVAHKGFVFAKDFNPFVREVSASYGRPQELSTVYGWNGYDPKSGSMRTPLIVSGPAFRKGLGIVGGSGNSSWSAPTTIHLFPLLCKVLDLLDACSKRNGSLENAVAIQDILEAPEKTVTQKTYEVIQEAISRITNESNLPVTGKLVSHGCFTQRFRYTGG